MSFDTDIAEREQPLSAELYSFAFTNDFILGKTVYFPVMQSYVNSYGDTMATPGLVDTDLVLEEYY